MSTRTSCSPECRAARLLRRRRMRRCTKRRKLRELATWHPLLSAARYHACPRGESSDFTKVQKALAHARGVQQCRALGPLHRHAVRIAAAELAELAANRIARLRDDMEQRVLLERATHRVGTRAAREHGDVLA